MGGRLSIRITTVICISALLLFTRRGISGSASHPTEKGDAFPTPGRRQCTHKYIMVWDVFWEFPAFWGSHGPREDIPPLTPDQSEKLIVFRKRILSEYKNFCQRVRGATMTQGPSESVQEFAARINKLGTQIFQSGNSAQNTAVRNANDQLLQSRFISGLRNDIRRFVLSRDLLNLEESINAALIEEQNMKINQIASEERSGLSSAQTENSVLSALADRLQEINLRVGRLQEASAVTARKSGGNYFNRRENVFKCFYCGIQGHKQAECRKRQRDERAARYQPPRRNAASEYSSSSSPRPGGRHVHFRESTLRDNYAAPRHSVRAIHTNSENRGFQRFRTNQNLNSRGESRI
ncbi:hypothetical protein TNCV_3347071 [Trichonephila clavipes]|nr:hypothetical protein TNCV_3347071 [Trichonephila clavipes]